MIKDSIWQTESKERRSLAFAANNRRSKGFYFRVVSPAVRDAIAEGFQRNVVQVSK